MLPKLPPKIVRLILSLFCIISYSFKIKAAARASEQAAKDREAAARASEAAAKEREVS